MIYTCAGEIQEEWNKSTLTDLRDENALQQVTESISNELGKISDSGRIQRENVRVERRNHYRFPVVNIIVPKLELKPTLY